MYKFKKDSYQKSRGGTSRILDVSCEHCSKHVAFYQKDGPGILKRMYVDRFIDTSPKGSDLICENCDRQLGTLIDYKKENRPAYRLFVGAVTKKIVSRDKLS
jgi:hypothetical protein